MEPLRVVVVRYPASVDFNERQALRLLARAVMLVEEGYGRTSYVLLMHEGDGIPSLASFVVANRSNWTTAPIDNITKDSCDLLIRVGGGDEVRQLADAFWKQDGTVLEFYLRAS